MDVRTEGALLATRAGAAGVPVGPWWAPLVMFGLCAAGAGLAWRSRSTGWAAGLGAGAVLAGVGAWQRVTWSALGALPVLLAAAGAAGLLGVWWWARSESVVTRWGNRSRRKSGVASSVDIWRKASPRAVRRRARVVRPSLELLSSRELRQIPVTEFAVMVCRVGRQRVWASCEVVVLVFGSPRKGKSAMLAGTILDAPGAVVTTSTKLDLLRATRELRARRGPVWVFNPGGDGGAEAASTVAFDVRAGCESPVAATERARDMVGAGGDAHAGGGTDRAYWDGQATRVLASLLHAAALSGGSLMDVQRWAADPDGSSEQVFEALRGSDSAALAADYRQFVKTNERTRTSITASIMPALGWLAHPAAAAAGNATGTGLPALDVAELLAARGTVYLIGAEEANVAPLVCALTGYIAREARRLAALAPGERLDPQLTMVLDEAAQVCPVPLERWSADMGGRGLCLVAGFQSRAQLLARYGVARAAVILNNAGVKVLFGGTSDRDDAQWWSNLAGERDEVVVTRDGHGTVTSRSTRRVPVLATSELLTMDPHQVVAFAPSLLPVIGWAERYWRRPDVRAIRHPNALDVRARAWRTAAAAAARGWAEARARRWLLDPLAAGKAWALGWAAVRAARWRARGAEPAIGEPLTTGRGDHSGRGEHLVVPGEVIDPVPSAEPAAAGGAEVIRFPDRRGDRDQQPAEAPTGDRDDQADGAPGGAADVWAGPDIGWWAGDERR